MHQTPRKERNASKPLGKTARPFIQLEAHEKKQLGIICVLAIVLRIIYFIHLKESVFFGNYILDSEVIDRWAKDIAGGNFWGDTAFFRAPFYIYIIAFIYKIFGSSPLPVLIFQSLLGLVTITLTYFYARILFGSKLAFFAGIVTSCWPTLIYFEGELMITLLSVFFFIFSLLLLHRALETGIAKTYLIAGVILGFGVITNPTLLPIFIIIPIYYLLSKDKSKFVKMFRHSVIYLLGMVVPIIPITIRNVVVAGDFVVISTQGGANFYIGNSKTADGITVEALGPPTKSSHYYEDNIWISSIHMAQYRLGQKLKDSEVSAYWFKEALKEMADQPSRAVMLLVKKFYYFWHGQEIFNNKSLYSSREYSWLMRFLIWKKFLNFPSGVLFPFMLVGIYCAIKNRQEIMIPGVSLLIYSATISLFFVCSRFRQPIVPVAIILATYGVSQIIQAIKQRETKGVLMVGGIFFSSFIILNFGGNIESEVNLSQGHSILGNLYYRKGLYDKAIENLEAALVVLPDNMDVFRTLVPAYIKAGRLNDAERTSKRAIALYPQFSEFNYNLGALYFATKRYLEAKPLLQKAIQYDPKFPSPYLLLGTIYEQETNKDSAQYIYNQLLRLDPNNVGARQRLSRLGGE